MHILYILYTKQLTYVLPLYHHDVYSTQPININRWFVAIDMLGHRQHTVIHAYCVENCRFDCMRNVHVCSSYNIALPDFARSKIKDIFAKIREYKGIIQLLTLFFGILSSSGSQNFSIAPHHFFKNHQFEPNGQGWGRLLLSP